jgi:hypothetical protein
MLSPRLSIRNWAAGARTESGWRAYGPERADAGAPPTIPPMLRRRVSDLGQAATRAAFGLSPGSETRIVLCSRKGEFDRTLRLLEAIAEEEPLSPAEFSMSVHHALAGLLSIALGNMAGHTAIAAGTDSFGFGLLEAAATIAERPAQDVLLLYFDEPLRRSYACFDSDERSIALALLLGAPSSPRSAAELEAQARRGSGVERPTTAQAFDFLEFLAERRDETQSRGARIDWTWRRAH